MYNAVVACRLMHAKYLLEHDCAVNTRNEDGETPLIGAIRWIPHRDKRLRLFRWLLSRGADLDLCDFVYNRDALLWAAFLNRTDEIRHLLIDLHIDVDMRRCDVHGRCALHYAVLHNNQQAVLWLTRRYVKYRVAVDIEDEHGATPFMIASMLGYSGCAHILREIGGASRVNNASAFVTSAKENIWSGTSEWSDPRFNVEKSQKLDKLFVDSLPSISSKTKVTFNDVIERIDADNVVKERKPVRRRNPRHGTQSTSPNLKFPQLKSKSESPDAMSRTLNSVQTGEKRSKFVFLKRMPRSAVKYRYDREKTVSVKRKQLPLIFDLYAQQLSPAFNTAAKPSKRKPPQLAPLRQKRISKQTGTSSKPPPAMSFGVLGKVTKFAAIMKMRAAASTQKHNAT